MAHIRSIVGIGPQAVQVFTTAGIHSVTQLTSVNFDRTKYETISKKLLEAVETLHAAHGPDATSSFTPEYWMHLYSRCVSIAYRANSSNAAPFIPDVFMCPLSLDWFQEPLVTASGHSYSRWALEDSMTRSLFDPVTGQDLTPHQPYPNHALMAAVDWYRRSPLPHATQLTS